MKPLKYIKIFFGALLLTCSAGCQKGFDYEISNNSPDTSWLANISDTAEVSQLKRSIKPVTFTDSTAYNNQPTQVNLQSGLRVSFPGGLTSIPGTITTGIIKMESILLKKKGDFIRMGVHTRENERMLSSVGTLFLHVTKNGQPMRFTQGVAEISYASNSIQGPATSFIDTDSLAQVFNWTRNPDTLLSNVNWSQGFYSLRTNNFGWINAANRADAGNNLTTIQVSLPAHYTNKNTAAYLLYNDGLVVDMMQPNTSTRKFIANPVATGTPVKLLVLSKQAGNYFMAQSSVTAAGGIQNVLVEPTITTMNLLLQELENL
ncbi:MAG: hypothetical protein WAT19_12285 [Ferruginibacter sp.]